MRRSRSVLAALGLLAVAALLAGTALGGVEEDDPRNRAHKEALDALCTAHHSNEGFLPMTLTYPEVYQQVKVGEPFPVSLNIRDPWIHQIYDVTARLDLGNATGFQFVAEGLAEPFVSSDTVVLQKAAPEIPGGNPRGPSSFSAPFVVEENATEIFVFASAPPGTGSQVPSFQNTITLSVMRNLTDKPSHAGDGTNNYKSVRLANPQQIASNGYGDWRVDVAYVDGPDPEVPVTIGIGVYYNVTGATAQTLAPLGEDALRETESTTVTWTLLATEPTADAVLDFKVLARTHYDHPAATGAQDNGHYIRYATMTVDAGGSFVRGQAQVADKQPTVVVDAYNLATRVLGFTTALVIPLAMVTGGMFGKGSRRGLNRFTGGARKRVLWHSAVSWVIIGIGAVHLILAIIESQFVWTKGLFWGGAGFVALVTLGVTGYWQVRIIKRFSYRTWRHVHLWSAMMVFFMGLMHTFIDGSDLGTVRDSVPQLERLIWP